MTAINCNDSGVACEPDKCQCEVDAMGPYPSPEDSCDHDWIYTGTAYGGDDESYRGEGRVYCSRCGADGDA